MKFTFTLRGLDINKIHKTYDLNISSNLTNEKLNQSVTKITELVTNNEDKTFMSFLEDKNGSKYHVTMLDYLKADYLPSTTNIRCFWCHSSFDWAPIGCPIKYCSSQLEKSYFSEITKDKYTIRENITTEKRESFSNIDPKKKDKYKIIEKEYYETDGIFCSFNCCLSFIGKNKGNVMYKYSHNLLKKIYFDVFGVIPEKISLAPSYRLLKEYGGDLSISEFRKGLNKLEYTEKSILKNNLKFKTLGFIYSEKVKLNL
jgi:hypothetical protein